MKNCSVACLVINNFTNDSRVLKESISLKKNGYKPFVIALHDNNLLEQENISDISVTRLRLFSRSWSKNKFVQVFKYVEWLIRSAYISRTADVMHCNDLNTLPVGVFVKLFINPKAKVVYDAHEYETEIDGLDGVEKKLAAWLERLLIKHADRVITVSDTIANEYHRLYAIPKPDVVLNCPPLQTVQKANKFRDKFHIRNEQKILLYQGALFEGRGIENLLQAFETILRDDVVVVFMGYGPLESMILESTKSHSAIFYHPAVPPDQLLRYTASADIGICAIKNSCLSFYYCLPNKFFEYAMAGLPVLVSNLAEMKRLVDEYQCGMVMESDTPDGILVALEKIMADDLTAYSSNSRKMSEDYNWETQEMVLLSAYREILLTFPLKTEPLQTQ